MFCLEKGLVVSIALNAAYHLKKPAVVTLKKTDKADENATLLADAVVGEKEIQLEVGTLEETLASGKSAIDLEDLPFTQLVVPAKKWGDADAVLTIARREAVANEDGSLYSEYYLVRNSSPLPVFRRRDDAFDVYRDYYTPVAAAPVVAKTNEPAQTTIVGETQQAAPVAEVQKPEKTLRLKADTL